MSIVIELKVLTFFGVGESCGNSLAIRCCMSGHVGNITKREKSHLRMFWVIMGLKDKVRV